MDGDEKKNICLKFYDSAKFDLIRFLFFADCFTKTFLKR